MVIVDAYRVHDFWYKRVVATRYNMLGANPNLHTTIKDVEIRLVFMP